MAQKETYRNLLIKQGHSSGSIGNCQKLGNWKGHTSQYTWWSPSACLGLAAVRMGFDCMGMTAGIPCCGGPSLSSLLLPLYWACTLCRCVGLRAGLVCLRSGNNSPVAPQKTVPLLLLRDKSVVAQGRTHLTCALLSDPLLITGLCCCVCEWSKQGIILLL